LERLHDNLRGIHQDIKGANIFVSRAQQRLVLGDFGVASEQGAGGLGPVRGRTRGFQSPEQVGEQPFISAASDVFSLCVTVINFMLQHDPAVAAQWIAYWGNQPRPAQLFATEADHLDVVAYETWRSYLSRSAPEPQTEMTVLSELYGVNGAARDAYIYKYHCIGSVFRRLDPVLWRQLLRGLQVNAHSRLRAAQFCRGPEFAQVPWLSEAEKQRMQRVWAAMPDHSDAIAKALRRVRSRAKPLLLNAQAPARP
jgi:serine/threonine protein kinase